MRWMVLTAAVGGCDDGGGGAMDAGPTADAEPMDVGAPADVGEIADAALDAEPAPDVGAADAAAPDGPLYTACPPAERRGGFLVSLAADYTAVQGQVTDSTDPAFVEVEADADGPCRLLRPAANACEPGCEVGFTCGPDGCVPRPEAVDMGTVTVSGLADPVEMTATPPVWFYTFRGDLTHPAFAEGDPIELEADGGDGLTLRGVGVAALEVPVVAVALDPGAGVPLTWAAAGEPGRSQVLLDLNIANHGGTPARVECVVPDTGSFTIPAALSDQLLDLGFSGFPSVALTRQTLDSAEAAVGCVDFAVRSEVVLDVDIAGLISCSFDEDCPEGQTCQPDLSCGG